MRLAALLLSVTPSFAFADTIIARITPTDVTVFTQGAKVTRKGKIELPAGLHDIVIPDLRPNAGGTQTPEVAIKGATLISETWENNNQTPLPEPNTSAYLSAKADLTAAENAVTALNDQITTTLLEKSAAATKIEFLKSLASSERLPEGIDSLRDLSRMISQETLSAQTTIQQAEITARKLDEDRPDLIKAVVAAQRMVDALLPPSNAFARLVLTVSVPEAITSDLELSYVINEAAWQPVYDLRLSTGDTPTLAVERGALISQQSGERWDNVNLTLSTIAPREHPEPWEISVRKLQISEPVVLERSALRATSQADFKSTSEPVLAAPIILEEAQSPFADLSGTDVQYNFDFPVSVDSTQAFNRIALETLNFEAEIEARAIPLNNQTAFRMVSFTNDSGERMLPAQANLYVDDRLIAETQFDQIVPGAETEIGFGPIHGLRLSRTILDRNEGDRGIISRSNQNTQTVRIDVENLTDRAWPVTLIDRVPFTEQEDLNIDWSTTPRPDATNYKDQRGILRWDLDVAAGSTQSVTLDTTITWPEGMELR